MQSSLVLKFIFIFPYFKIIFFTDYNISTDEIELFHYIMLSYGAITDVMKQINDSYAVVLILMLLSFFLHLVLAPYYLITYCGKLQFWFV